MGARIGLARRTCLRDGVDEADPAGHRGCGGWADSGPPPTERASRVVIRTDLRPKGLVRQAVLGTHWPWRPIDEGDARAVIEAIRRRFRGLSRSLPTTARRGRSMCSPSCSASTTARSGGLGGRCGSRRLPPPRPLPQLERGGSGAGGGEGSEPDPRAAPPWPDRFPFEQLTVPTLVISARDDDLAPYRFAAEAARRIPRRSW